MNGCGNASAQHGTPIARSCVVLSTPCAHNRGAGRARDGWVDRGGAGGQLCGVGQFGCAADFDGRGFAAEGVSPQSVAPRQGREAPVALGPRARSRRPRRADRRTPGVPLGGAQHRGSSRQPAGGFPALARSGRPRVARTWPCWRRSAPSPWWLVLLPGGRLARPLRRDAARCEPDPVRLPGACSTTSATRTPTPPAPHARSGRLRTGPHRPGGADALSLCRPTRAALPSRPTPYHAGQRHRRALVARIRCQRSRTVDIRPTGDRRPAGAAGCAPPSVRPRGDVAGLRRPSAVRPASGPSGFGSAPAGRERCTCSGEADRRRAARTRWSSSETSTSTLDDRGLVPVSFAADLGRVRASPSAGPPDSPVSRIDHDHGPLGHRDRGVDPARDRQRPPAGRRRNRLGARALTGRRLLPAGFAHSRRDATARAGRRTSTGEHCRSRH